ncbi:hypothetical protein RDWZM_003004 [Blomia tropicalis]|uniref:EGF-like domain-containing protein n=1 Tax=Blomia tropicalis TaxID=40697 RepID=A0A9Q0MEU4_BLOTA|nr:hypothetical protein RDWZM_003004 [Blomia tropicalis]
MKRRSPKIGIRPLVILVLFQCASITIQLPEGIKRWLPVTKETWPEMDDNPTEPFYMFSTQNEPISKFGFNQNLFTKEQLYYNNVDLSFKYWSNSYQTTLRSKLSHTSQQREIQLDTAHKWTGVNVTQISLDDWNNFHLYNYKDFNMAFKDIEVTFFEKIQNEKAEMNKIHGYKNENTYNGIIPQTMNQKSNSVAVNEKQGFIVFDEPLELNDDITLEFEFQTLPILSENVVVKAFLNHDESDCNFEFVSTFKTSFICILEGGKIAQLFVTTSSHGFVLMNAQLKSKSTNWIKNAKINTTGNYGNTYKIVENLSYMNLINSESNFNDDCYTLIQSKENGPIDVYLTHPNGKVGKNLLKIEKTQKFCLNEFVALRNLLKYQLTFVVHNGIVNSSFVLMKSSDSSNFKVYEPTTEIGEMGNNLAGKWFYYNDQFDYSLEGPEDDLMLCDTVANCFRYDRKEISADSRKYSYTLNQKLKQSLIGSRFVRLVSDKQEISPNTYNFKYLKTSKLYVMNKIQQNLKILNPNIGNPIVTESMLSFNYKVAKTDEFKIKIPIDDIDLRIFQLDVSFQDNEEVEFKSISFISNNDESQSNDLTVMFAQQSSIKKNQFSTNDIFQINSFDLTTSIKGHIMLIFKIVPKQGEIYWDLKFSLTLLKKQVQELQDGTVLEPKEYGMLNPFMKNKVLIKTEVVRSNFDQTLPTYKVKFILKADDKNIKLTKSDFKITQYIMSQGIMYENDKSVSLTFLSSKYYQPTTNPKYIEYLPYQTDPNEQSYLVIEKPVNWKYGKDFCVRFKYDSKDSTLIGSRDGSYKYEIEYPVEEAKEEHICASWLSNEYEFISYLLFHFKEKMVDINFHSVTIMDSVYSPDDEQSINNKGIYDDQLSRKTFLGMDERFELNVDENGHNMIIYRINDVQQLKKKTKTITNYLRTGWIKLSNAIHDKIRLSLIYDEPKNITGDSTLTFSTPNGPFYIMKLSDFGLKNGPIHTIDLTQNFTNSLPQYIEVTIKMVTDLSMVADDEKSLTFKLDKFSINDPCLNDLGEIRMCNHGKCDRKYDIFESQCKCKTGYKGDVCDKIYYCEQPALNILGSGLNQEICFNLGLKCSDDDNLKTFRCDCKNDDERWNLFTLGCVKTNLDCTENEEIQILNNVAQCACKDGFIRLDSDSECIVYDPCSTKHRKLNHQSPETCLDSHAECSPIGTNFECNCKTGYFNQLGLKHDNAKCISNSCDGCDQNCVYNSKDRTYECQCNKGYTLDDNGKCWPNDDTDITKCASNITEEGYPTPFLVDGGRSCSCSGGFVYNGTTKTCILDQRLKTIFGCNKIELNKDDHIPGCVCANGQMFDPITRRCTDQCTVEREQKCSEAKAQCVVMPHNSETRCICAQDEIATASSLNETEKWLCLPKCSLLNLTENIDKRYCQLMMNVDCIDINYIIFYRCQGTFEQCNALKIEFDHITENREVYVAGNSSISSMNHCECQLGFERVYDQCQPKTSPPRTIEGLNFELTSTTNDNNHLVQVKKALVQVLGKLLNADVVVDETKCESKSETLVSCNTTFSSIYDMETIQLLLKNDCIPYGKDNDKCMYLVRKTKSSTDGAIALMMPDINATITVQSFDFCKREDRCNGNYLYSLCKSKQISNENYFECVCNEDLFEIQTLNRFHLYGDSLRMENCKKRDMCNVENDQFGCKDETAECHFMVEYENGKYTPWSFCTCPETGLTLNNRTDSCVDSCDGFCVNGECARLVSDRKKLVCKCPKQFYGDRCEHKYEVDVETTDDSTNGYKVATIILAVLFSLCLIGLVIFILRKKIGFLKFG